MRPVIRGTGLVAVVAGIAAVVTGLALPWTLSGSRHPDGVTIAGIVFLGPLLSGLCVAYARTEPRRFRLTAAVAAVAGLAATLVAIGLARLVEPSAGVGLGGPVTVAGAAALTLGWLLAAIGGPGALPGSARPWLTVAATVVVLAVVAGFAVDYAREGRFVDATTAGDPPTAAGDQTWPLPYVGVQLVGVHDQLAIVRAEDGVRAVWLASGAIAWRYLRSDLPTQTAGLVDGPAGGTVVVVFGTDDGVLVTALDAGSGQVRFTARYQAGKMASVHGAGRTVVLAGSGIGAGDLLGIDATAGTLLWRWTPARNGGPCDVTDLATTAETVAVALRCRAQGVDDVAVGLTATTGAERWSWHTIQRSPTELRIYATGDGFVTVTGASPAAPSTWTRTPAPSATATMLPAPWPSQPPAASCSTPSPAASAPTSPPSTSAPAPSSGTSGCRASAPTSPSPPPPPPTRPTSCGAARTAASASSAPAPRTAAPPRTARSPARPAARRSPWPPPPPTPS
ncbi:hypothetical protein GCM10027610_111010 [Dactylosporangium cerinum]